MTKFAIFGAGILLCAALLTGCGSQTQTIPQEDPVTSYEEDSHPQYNAQFQADSSVPPAVRERPHLASELTEDDLDVTKNS